jgi:hypothetical protein
MPTQRRTNCDLVVADHHQPGKLRCPRYADGLDLAEVDHGRILKRDGVPPVTVIAICELDAVGQLAGSTGRWR